MNPLDLNLPDGSRFTNHLYPTKAIGYLLEDLIVVVLPNGIIIDAGWYPEHDPSGKYVVRAYSRDWEEQIGTTVTATQPLEVRRIVEAIAQAFSRDLVSFSDALSSSSGSVLYDMDDPGGYAVYIPASILC
jgi:hypothetical protein